MPLALTREAIGETAELLRTELTSRTTAVTVDVGRLENAAGAAGPKFNLFLYQLDFDGYLRNHALDQGQQPPLWVVLRYLLTAFDSTGESDTVEAQRLLGEGLLALQSMNYLQGATAPLLDNPESLKVTFDSAEAELLSKIMQGNNDRYRMSIAFQVRPVMLAFTTPAAQAPLVQSVGPPATPGVVVIPSLGPIAYAVEPPRFGAGEQILITGLDLGGENQEVLLEARFQTTTVIPDNITDESILATVPATLSAGSYLIRVARVMPSGRRFSSNPLLGHLLPIVANATIPNPLSNSGANLFGLLEITGDRLGGPDDSIFVSFYTGAVALTMEVAGTIAQTTLTVDVLLESAIPSAIYRIILRVNGEQAVNSPEVNWS